MKIGTWGTSPTIITSNREPPAILTMMADPLLAQSAMDRLQSAAYGLVVEGESYQQRQKPCPASQPIQLPRIDRRSPSATSPHGPATERGRLRSGRWESIRATPRGGAQEL
ncbi:hypothetical protein BST20_27280 [Mycobacterium branderi]|uniref:Uncharacterized protein n=1 Tax=Mycobacterium branderi TaxID=43348 RepID=A0A7I7W370_9MYCO|nr:hypothetical protein BST20_27280 [Mycobacterium branderi]BBZ12054.1 hypothetical protein MBRA_22490 [Mycobacterium branderi]